MQYVLFNPQAGNGSGAQQARALDARFPEETFSYTDMTTISDYAAWLGTLPADASLIIAGGDGTLNRFLNDTDGMALPEKLYYFATGSGNDFLHDLGLEKGADSVPVAQHLRDLPTVTVNGKHWRFLNGIGYGIDGYCCEVGDALRGKSDKPVNYTAIAIKGLLFHFHPPPGQRRGHGRRQDEALSPRLARADDERPLLRRRHDGHAGPASRQC